MTFVETVPAEHASGTVAAARRLRSISCMLTHGSVLADKFLEPDALRAVVADHRTAGPDAVA
jgi:hypothetical protein